MSNSKSIHNQHENYELKPCPSRSKLYTTKEKLICAWNNTLKEVKGESSVNIDHSSLCKTETYNVETSG